MSNQLTGGRVIDNPVSGERMVIRQTAEETHGELLTFDLYLPPGGHVPAPHIHPAQEERFTVLTGKMHFRVNDQKLVTAPGETVIIKAGRAHWFANATADTTIARVEIRPALRMQELLESASRMRAFRTWRGLVLPNLPALAAFLLDFKREVSVPRIPAGLLSVCLPALARFSAESPTHRG